MRYGPGCPLCRQSSEKQESLSSGQQDLAGQPKVGKLDKDLPPMENYAV